jgi:hypothetical protein
MNPPPEPQIELSLPNEDRIFDPYLKRCACGIVPSLRRVHRNGHSVWSLVHLGVPFCSMPEEFGQSIHPDTLRRAWNFQRALSER